MDHHNLTHWPLKAWCSHCTAARGKDDPHPSVAASRFDEPHAPVQMDYFYTSDPKDTTRSHWTCLVAVCTSTGAVWCSTVIGKGSSWGRYGLSSFGVWLREFGHVRDTSQTDGEPTIMEFAEAARKKANDAATLEIICHRVSPRDSHASNGAAERAVQTLRGFAKLYLHRIPSVCGELPADSPWWC